MVAFSWGKWDANFPRCSSPTVLLKIPRKTIWKDARKRRKIFGVESPGAPSNWVATACGQRQFCDSFERKKRGAGTPDSPKRMHRTTTLFTKRSDNDYENTRTTRRDEKDEIRLACARGRCARTHFDTGARSDLVLPLPRHDLGIDTGHLNAGVKAFCVVLLRNLAADSETTTGATVVGSLRGWGRSILVETAGRSGLSPDPRRLHQGILLLDREPPEGKAVWDRKFAFFLKKKLRLSRSRILS